MNTNETKSKLQARKVREGYIQTKHHKVCKRCGLPNDNTAGSCVMCGREFEWKEADARQGVRRMSYW